MQKLCVIYNTAPRYREAVFRAIDKEYDCDWYFGETKSDIKEMDTSLLKNVTYYKTYGNPQKWYWKRNYFVFAFQEWLQELSNPARDPFYERLALFCIGIHFLS